MRKRKSTCNALMLSYRQISVIYTHKSDQQSQWYWFLFLLFLPLLEFLFQPQLATTSLVSFKLPEGVDSSVFKLIFVPSGDLIPVISNLQIEVCYEGN